MLYHLGTSMPKQTVMRDFTERSIQPTMAIFLLQSIYKTQGLSVLLLLKGRGWLVSMHHLWQKALPVTAPWIKLLHLSCSWAESHPATAGIFFDGCLYTWTDSISQEIKKHCYDLLLFHRRLEKFCSRSESSRVTTCLTLIWGYAIECCTELDLWSACQSRSNMLPSKEDITKLLYSNLKIASTWKQ